MCRKFAVFLVFLGVISVNLLSQEKVNIGMPSASDTSMVFESPLPLYNPNRIMSNLLNNWGINLSLSVHGFGMGTTFDWGITENFSLTANLMISGARNTDEFESWDYARGEYRVHDKINRLILVPMTVGGKYYVLSSLLTENFKPFITGGVGTAWILATPYDREFFNAFHHSQSFMRFAGCVGIGSDFGIGRSLLTVNLKQYFIPFGGDGIESVKRHPLKEFGGFQIDILLGIRY